MNIGFADKKDAWLILADGKTFKGKSVGVEGTCFGEICFNTGMCGYQEIFTDPSYKGQIVVMTSAHIGNYGVVDADNESDSPKVSGIVVKNFSWHYSRAGAESLLDYLHRNQIIALCDIDTRAIVRYIRDKGAMNAALTTHQDQLESIAGTLKDMPGMEGKNLSVEVSTQEITLHESNSQILVGLIDYGVKANIVRCLSERGASVIAFPLNTPAETILSYPLSGILFSNGPGDPSAMPQAIALVKTLVKSNIPCFGICLGHQLLAKAFGLNTYKMFIGHRGINHPVLNNITGKGEITSQNHGFAVEQNLQTEEIIYTHVHLNDGTVAGIKLKNYPAFSVQYHPEAAPGPHDSRYLFDVFFQNMHNYSHTKQATEITT